jgi:hypothetical protein
VNPRYSNGRFMARHTMEAEQASHLLRRAVGRLDQALFQHRETMAELAKPRSQPVPVRIEAQQIGYPDDMHIGPGRPPLNPDQCEL